MVVNQRARRYTSLTWKVENAMESLNVIQTVVDMTRAKTYLEIGVASWTVIRALESLHADLPMPRWILRKNRLIGYHTTG